MEITRFGMPILAIDPKGIIHFTNNALTEVCIKFIKFISLFILNIMYIMYIMYQDKCKVRTYLSDYWIFCCGPLSQTY